MPGIHAAIPAFGFALPEIVLAIGALALVLLGAIRGERSVNLVNGIALAILVLVGVLVMTRTGRATTFNGSFVQDDFAKFMKIAALVGSGVALAMSVDFWRGERVQRFEYAILILLATLGMMMMISAGDLIALYLGLELMSLALYVVAAIHRDSVRATEAGLKYFVLGALSSG